MLVGALFDSLTATSADGNVVPALATSWVAGEDARRFTFRLDPAATWSDGSPVVAQDVRRAWTRQLDATAGPPGAAAPLLDVVDGAGRAARGGRLTGVDAPDPHTLVVRLRRPVPEFPRLVADPGLAPVPPAATRDTGAFAEAPVGNGPWQLAEPWAHNQFLRLEAVTDHPRPGVVEELVFRVYGGDEDGAQRYGDLQDGSIGVAQLAPGDRARARRDFGVSDGEGSPGVHDTLTAAVSVLLLDTARPPLDDVRVRQAMALLVDRQAMGAASTGERVAADTLVPPVVDGAPEGGCELCRLDGAAARALLDAAAADRDEATPLPTIRIVTSADEIHRDAAEGVASGLRAAGWPALVVSPEPSRYLEEAAEAHAVRVAWVPESPLLRSWGQDLLGAGELARDATNFDPPPLRDALARVRRGTSAAEQREALLDLLQLVLDEAAVVPLVHYRDDLVVGTEVTGLVRGPLGDVELTAVRVTPQRP